MLCEWNDDVTNSTLSVACIAACEKLTRHELAVASKQCAPAFKKWKLESVCDWCNGKGIQSAYFRYDSNFSKCKQSLFARYRAPSTLLAFKFCRTLHWC